MSRHMSAVLHALQDSDSDFMENDGPFHIMPSSDSSDGEFLIDSNANTSRGAGWADETIEIGLDHSSTPRRPSGFSYILGMPIDLTVDYVPARTYPAGRDPPRHAFIDLCTPERTCPSPRRIQNVESRTADASTCSASQNSSMEESYKCPICMEPARRREPCSTRCGHVFCRECLTSAVRVTKKCPLCQAKVNMRHVVRIYL